MENKMIIEPDYYFSQQHIYTQMGHTLPLIETPHFKFLETRDEEIYKTYLRISWQFYKPDYTEADINERVKYFKDLLRDIKLNGVKKPVEYFVRPNGDKMIYDGNHRAVIARYLNIPFPKKEMSFLDAVASRVKVPGSFYGSKRLNVPYQSIYSPDGDIVVKGRRSDIVERFNLIDKKDITDKDVIDIGCNYGNTLMLCQNARSLTGVDVDASILTASVRLAVFFAKDISYIQFDMNNKLHEFIHGVNSFDTAFIFSVDAHLKTLDGLVWFIRNKVKHTVYFETHEGREMPEDIRNLFSHIELLGELPGSRGLANSRKFYKCAM